MKRGLICIIILLLILGLAINVYAEEETVQNTEETQNNTVTNEIINVEAKAKVLEAGEVKQVETGSITDTVQEVKIKILEGSHKGEEFTTNYILSYDIEGKILAYELEKDDIVWVQLTENTDGTVGIAVENIVRQNYILLMIIVFFASIILIGRKKGIQAIAGLIVTVLAVYFILVKSIYLGKSPMLMSIITSAIIIISTLIIIGGINKKVITAAIGTLGGVIIAGVFSAIFGYLTKLSGACEDAVQLSINASSINFNFRELLFAGIIISALGACMDVGMSIASSLDEIKSKTPDITGKELFKSGMNIGKDVIGTMCNTLILAYVGGALTLIILFKVCEFNIIQIINKETILEEIISAVAGSTGVLYTVPITAFVYSILNRDKTIYKKTSDNKIDGKRSLKL
ncbi:MAG: YibE/F family protein [Candidatus Scatovivens sp.]